MTEEPTPETISHSPIKKFLGIILMLFSLTFLKQILGVLVGIGFLVEVLLQPPESGGNIAGLLGRLTAEALFALLGVVLFYLGFRMAFRKKPPSH